MSEPKLTFDQRKRANVVLEELVEEGTQEALAYELIWSRDEIERLRALLAEALRASDEHPDGPMLNSDTAATIRKIIGDVE